MQIKRTIRRPEVLQKTGLSNTTIHRLEHAGQFPKHFMLTPRCAVWDEAEVDAWLDARKAMPAQAAQGPDVSLRKSALGRQPRRVSL